MMSPATRLIILMTHSYAAADETTMATRTKWEAQRQEWERIISYNEMVAWLDRFGLQPRTESSMNNQQQPPTITDKTIYTMPTDALVALVREARIGRSQSETIYRKAPRNLYQHNRDTWRELVETVITWRSLVDRCQSALTRRGVW
jgi:hypothetical protein